MASAIPDKDPTPILPASDIVRDSKRLIPSLLYFFCLIAFIICLKFRCINFSLNEKYIPLKNIIIVAINHSILVKRFSITSPLLMYLSQWLVMLFFWKLEVRSRRSEVGSQKLEVGGWRLEVGIWKLEIRNWKLKLQSGLGVSLLLSLARHRHFSLKVDFHMH